MPTKVYLLMRDQKYLDYEGLGSRARMYESGSTCFHTGSLVVGVYSTPEAAEKQIATGGTAREGFHIVESTVLDDAAAAGRSQKQFWGYAYGQFKEIFGYRKSWKGHAGWGWLADQKPPTDDPRVAEFLRLKNELGVL